MENVYNGGIGTLLVSRIVVSDTYTLPRGCVSPNILMELGASNILNTTGFKKLTYVLTYTHDT